MSDASAPSSPPTAKLGLTPLQAGLAAAVLALVGAAVLAAVSVRQGRDAFGLAAGAVLAVGGLAAGAARALRLPWGGALSSYVGWGGVVVIVIRILSQQLSMPWDAIAGAAFVAISALPSPPRPKAPPSPSEPPPPPDSMPLIIKENAEAIIVAFIMALVIRCFCIEVFKIPSSSMEPTLLGDKPEINHHNCSFPEYHVHPSGDRIMVTKYYYAFAPVERYDVVVFKFPLNQAKNFIKRVVGLPDESLRVYRGNLYVKKKGDADFRIAPRSLRTQDSVWIRPQGTSDALRNADTFFGAWNPGDSAWQAQNGELSTQEKGGKRDSSFLLRSRLAEPYGHRDVGDCRIAMEIEPTSTTGHLFLAVRNEYGRFELRLDAAGGSALHFEGPDGKESGPITGFQLALDRSHRVDLSVFDGTAYARIDGREVAKIEFITTREKLKEVERPEHAVLFGAKGATFKARDVVVGRDLYYKGEGTIAEDVAFDIGPEQYVMMGDNVDSSHDSRKWTRKTFVMKDGRRIVCEGQEINSATADQTVKRLELKSRPDYVIDGDLYGTPHGFSTEDVVDGRSKDDPFPTVDGKYIVGKALWIWWPKGRWFSLIR